MKRKYSYKLSQLTEDLKTEVVFPSTDFEDVLIYSGDVHRPGLQLAGYHDHFDSNRVQLIGRMESAYMDEFPYNLRLQKWEELFRHKMPALIMCHGAKSTDEIIDAARKHDVTVLSTQAHTTEIMWDVIRIVKRAVAPRESRHGVLVEVYGMGLLLIGDSGVGKSEAAIELLKRGHRLIADDSVEITAVDVNEVEGTAPDLTRHYVEIRGIGVIDVRQIFGVGAVKAMQTIHLVVELEPWQDGKHYDRLGIEEKMTDILGVNVATVVVPVKPGRNLAVIMEVAAMDQRQKLMGFHAAKEFIKKIDKQFDDKMMV